MFSVIFRQMLHPFDLQKELQDSVDAEPRFDWRVGLSQVWMESYVLKPLIQILFGNFKVKSYGSITECMGKGNKHRNK